MAYRIRELREKKKLTQEQLAQMSGVSRTTIVIEHAMTIIPDGRKVFMFLKLQFLEGKARGELFKKYPPRYVYVSRSRILCAKNGMFEEMKAGGGSAVAYAWYEFQKGYKGVSIIKWIN